MKQWTYSRRQESSQLPWTATHNNHKLDIQVSCETLRRTPSTHHLVGLLQHCDNLRTCHCLCDTSDKLAPKLAPCRKSSQDQAHTRIVEDSLALDHYCLI